MCCLPCCCWWYHQLTVNILRKASSSDYLEQQETKAFGLRQLQVTGKNSTCTSAKIQTVNTSSKLKRTDYLVAERPTHGTEERSWKERACSKEENQRTGQFFMSQTGCGCRRSLRVQNAIAVFVVQLGAFEQRRIFCELRGRLHIFETLQWWWNVMIDSQDECHASDVPRDFSRHEGADRGERRTFCIYVRGMKKSI